jgi:hypothetical protein
VILAEPAVARWFGSDPAAFADEPIATTESTVLAIEHEDAVVGSVLCTEESDPD